MYKYGLEPLFNAQGLQHYYPLLESFTVGDAMVIHVSFFQSKDIFEIQSILTGDEDGRTLYTLRHGDSRSVRTM